MVAVKPGKRQGWFHPAAKRFVDLEKTIEGNDDQPPVQQQGMNDPHQQRVRLAVLDEHHAHQWQRRQIKPAPPFGRLAGSRVLPPVQFGEGERGGLVDFLPGTLDVRVSCHTPQSAGDSCLLRHNYHVTRLRPVIMTTLNATMPPDSPAPTGR